MNVVPAHSKGASSKHGVMGSEVSTEWKADFGAGKMAQRVKVLAAKPDDLSLIPQNRGGGRKEPSHKLSSGFHRHCGVCMARHTTRGGKKL